MRSPEPNFSSSKQLTIKFVVRLMTLCSRNVKRASKKLKALPTDIAAKSPGFHLPTKSTLRRVKPKKLLKTISNKAIMFAHRKKKGAESCGEEEFGDGGVWQREIMMGDKCQPLDFSGVIYYDSSGKRLQEIPVRSPRTSASPMPANLSEARKTDL